MPQIIPIKDLKNTSEISELCHKSDEPIFITKNGYGDMVIMSVDTYEQFISKLSLAVELEKGLKEVKNGETFEIDGVLNEITSKYK